MKKLIVLAITLSFLTISFIPAFAGEKENQAELVKLITVKEYLAAQRTEYVNEANTAIRMLNSQIQNIDQKIRALQPKPKKEAKKPEPNERNDR